MALKGRAWKYGENVNTDVIIPARYLNTWNPDELAKHCMEDLDPRFIEQVKPGDVVVATTNFGCGSSREHAPIALKAAGVSAVIATSFARIFYRNSMDMGLPILESEEAAKKVQDGDVLSIELDTGTITNETRGETYYAKPFPPFMLDLIKAGGLIEYVKAKVNAA
jgi:3-isopropylmalate/(R)-2-methylmalate dehydratase small subunit